jgi:hypothetical protein
MSRDLREGTNTIRKNFEGSETWTRMGKGKTTLIDGAISDKGCPTHMRDRVHAGYIFKKIGPSLGTCTDLLSQKSHKIKMLMTSESR